MYEMIQRLYQAGQLTKQGLAAAVAKGWITQAQKDELAAAEHGPEGGGNG